MKKQQSKRWGRNRKRKRKWTQPRGGKVGKRNEQFEREREKYENRLPN
jgi:hypothetical protein